MYTHKQNRAEQIDPAVGLTGFMFRYVPHEIPWMAQGCFSMKLMLNKHKFLVENDCLLRHRQELNFENKIQIVLMDRGCVSASLCTGPDRLNVRGRTPHHHRKKATDVRQRNTTKRAIEL